MLDLKTFPALLLGIFGATIGVTLAIGLVDRAQNPVPEQKPVEALTLAPAFPCKRPTYDPYQQVYTCYPEDRD